MGDDDDDSSWPFGQVNEMGEDDVEEDVIDERKEEEIGDDKIMLFVFKIGVESFGSICFELFCWYSITNGCVPVSYTRSKFEFFRREYTTDGKEVVVDDERDDVSLIKSLLSNNGDVRNGICKAASAEDNDGVGDEIGCDLENIPFEFYWKEKSFF